MSNSHPNLCILQLLRRDPRPAVQLEAGDEVLAVVEQQAHALHREVLALGALEVPQLAQAEERENIGVSFTSISPIGSKNLPEAAICEGGVHAKAEVGQVRTGTNQPHHQPLTNLQQY